jgi:hypothetical protein
MDFHIHPSNKPNFTLEGPSKCYSKQAFQLDNSESVWFKPPYSFVLIDQLSKSTGYLASRIGIMQPTGPLNARGWRRQARRDAPECNAALNRRS